MTRKEVHMASQIVAEMIVTFQDEGRTDALECVILRAERALKEIRMLELRNAKPLTI